MKFSVGDVVKVPTVSEMLKDERYDPETGSYLSVCGDLRFIGSMRDGAAYSKLSEGGGILVVKIIGEKTTICENLKNGDYWGVPPELISLCHQEIDW